MNVIMVTENKHQWHELQSDHNMHEFGEYLLLGPPHPGVAVRPDHHPLHLRLHVLRVPIEQYRIAVLLDTTHNWLRNAIRPTCRA